MREIRTSGSMSGEGKRSDATAPLLDSTSALSRVFPVRLVAPAVAEAGIILDPIEFRIHVAEFFADSLDEGSDVGAEP